MRYRSGLLFVIKVCFFVTLLNVMLLNATLLNVMLLNTAMTSVFLWICDCQWLNLDPK